MKKKDLGKRRRRNTKEEQRRKMWERNELMRKKQVKMDWEEKRWKKMRNPQERRRLTKGRENCGYGSGSCNRRR
jgi:hypothetical protein